MRDILSYCYMSEKDEKRDRLFLQKRNFKNLK